MHVAQLPDSHENGARSPARRAVSRNVSPAWYRTSWARPFRTIVTVSVVTGSERRTERRRTSTGDCAGDRSRLVAHARREREPLDEHLLRRHARDLERILDDVHERRRAAQVEVGVEIVADERAHEVGVHEALVGVEMVHDLEPIAVARRRGRRARPRKMTDSRVAVRVEQAHLSIGRRQRALDQRDHGRDPAAAGERDDRRGVVAQGEHARRAA